MSSAKIIGYDLVKTGGSYNVIKYKLLFELTNPLGTKYIGV